MKPRYDVLKKHYYSSTKGAANYVDGIDLYKEMGIDQVALMESNPAYYNTCAARVSLALIKSGVSFTGRMKIKEGEFKGKLIEPGAKLLADQLMKADVFGRPKMLTPTSAIKYLVGKKGVIFFWKMVGYGGGHIDLIELEHTLAICQSQCYMDSKEIWFWDLP